MTEFQIATLEIQRASLAMQTMGVWVAGVVGFAQCVLLGGGLLFMRRASIMRDRALDELIKGQAEARVALRESTAALKETTAALAEMLRRTEEL